MKAISRRTMLQGMGVAIGLPFLESMLPRTVLGGTSSAWPLRSAFFFIPNGVHLPDWQPTKEGKDFDLPLTLQNFEKFKDRLTVFTGLTLDAGRPHGDGAGDHARAGSTFLTGAHPVKTAGSNIRVGQSIDQVMATEIGRKTRFPSLELGLESGLNAGGCDSGYSCAYSSNISWRTPTTPSAKETNPKLVFARLFEGNHPGETAEGRARREKYQKSVLDFVMDDARSLEKRVSGSDRRKLDEYLTGIREIETRIEHFAQSHEVKKPNITIPEEKPDDFAEYFRLMGDLLLLSFQADLTRVATFMVGNAGSNRSYKMIDVPEGHHSLSHHGKDEAKQQKISKINQFHASQMAYVLNKMDQIKEGDGTMLNHSMIVYGSGLSDGDRHNHDDLPIVMLGKGGGALQTGQHIKLPNETPLCNLYLTMLKVMNVNATSFSDSRGLIESILA